MSPFSWQGQNLCGLSLAFIIDWRVVRYDFDDISLCLLFSQEVFDIFQNELGGVNLVEAPRREVMVSPEDWTCSGLNLNFLCLGPKRIICDQVHCVYGL